MVIKGWAIYEDLSAPDQKIKRPQIDVKHRRERCGAVPVGIHPDRLIRVWRQAPSRPRPVTEFYFSA